MVIDMSIIIQVTCTTKKSNSTKIPKFDGTEYPVSTMPVLLKHECSIIKPVFEIRLSNGFPNFKSSIQWNYCYVQEFERYYYITDIIQQSEYIWVLTCEIDVLATFRTQILNTNAFILYAQQNVNPMLSDERLPRTNISDVFHYEYGLGSSNGYYDEEGTFIIALNSTNTDGKNGFASVYALSLKEMQNLTYRLYNPTVFQAMKEFYENPLEAVISCIWIPVYKGKIINGMQEEAITFFDIDVGMNGYRANPVIEGEVDLPINLPYENWNDYRNIEPYTEYTCTLPGVGEIPLPMVSLLTIQNGGNGGDNVIINTLKYSISVVDGKITWTICTRETNNGIPNSEVAIYTGNIGVEMPIGNYWMNGAQFISGAIGVIAGGILIQSAGGEMSSVSISQGLGIAGSSFGNMLAARQNSYGGSGNLGGRSAKFLTKEFHINVKKYILSDEPENLKEVSGLPVFKKDKIGNYSGVIKVSDAYVECWATATEQKMLAQYVNSSVNYLYGGGLIIE